MPFRYRTREHDRAPAHGMQVFLGVGPSLLIE